MPVLRELISRFSFETDKKSVNNYHKTMGGMQKSAIKLGSILGLSLGGKALFGLGVSAKQAEEDLKRLAGTQLETLNNELFVMKQRLDNVQDGASNILRQKTINVLASNFIKDFGNANKEITQFTKLLEVAALQSTITGTSVEEVFTGLVAAIKTGDFSALVGVGGFDLKRQKITEDIIAAKDPKEIGGQFGRDIRTEALFSVIDNNLQEQRKQAANVSRELVALKITSTAVKDKTDELAEATTVAGLKTAEALFNSAKENKEALDKGEKSFFDVAKEGFFSLFSQGVDNIKERRGINSQKVEINMPTTIHVNEATDAEGVVKIFNQQSSKQLGEARRQIIRSEDTK